VTSTYRSVAEQSEAERGGERSILSRQSADHRDLNDLMLAHEAATDPARRAGLLTELAERALRHAFAEETVLFPAYRQYLPDSADVVSAHIENEHQAVNDSLQRLQDIDPQDPVYADLVSSTFQLIRDDARNEEDVLLPQLQQVLTEDALRTLGDAWEVARRTSPTRPHPKIPDAPRATCWPGRSWRSATESRTRSTPRAAPGSSYAPPGSACWPASPASPR
jgi:hemerythrin superfamily protein